MSQENANNKPLIRWVNRQQMSWRAVDVERLVDEDHLARAIWTLIGRMDLGQFYQSIESSAEEGGRPAFDPQLLISLWVYAYSQGIGSAREVARRCEYDPAFQWLTGLQEVNYHTLADFRVEKQKELDELFTQVLAALSKEGLVTLDQVMQDGTKIRAQASPRSVHWENQIQTHVERARRRVAEMGDPRSEEASPREKQARARARRERQERLEKSLEELEKLRMLKAARSPHKRVSITDPEARIMKQPDGGLALSYKCAAFHRCRARFNRRCARDASGERLGTVVAGAGTDRSKAAAAAQADCCGRGLHDARRDRGNGGTPDGFSGQHAPRRCEQWANRPASSASERFPFSARDQSLCVPGRQVPVPRRALEKRTRTSFPPLLGPGQGLPALCPQARVLS